MKTVEFASLYEFSFLLFDNYKKARDWRMRITDFEYMDHWKNWFGLTKTKYELYNLFQRYNIIIAYEPFTLPDWTRSIVGLLFYKQYTPVQQFKPYHTIDFDERRHNDEIYFVKTMSKRTDLQFLRNNVFPIYPDFEERMLKFLEHKYGLNLTSAMHIYKDYDGKIKTLHDNLILDKNIKDLIENFNEEIQIGKTYVIQSN